jgi:hypothetical protein
VIEYVIASPYYTRSNLKYSKELDKRRIRVPVDFRLLQEAKAFAMTATHIASLRAAYALYSFESHDFGDGTAGGAELVDFALFIGVTQRDAHGDGQVFRNL